MSTEYEHARRDLFFFDGLSCYSQRRNRKPSEGLPLHFVETRSSEAHFSKEDYPNRRRDVSENKAKSKAKPGSKLKKVDNETGRVTSDAFLPSIKARSGISLVASAEIDSALEDDILEEDFQRAVFEDAKLSATTILLQLEKLLKLVFRKSSVLGDHNNSSISGAGTEKPLLESKVSYSLPDKVRKLLQQKYEDLVVDTKYVKRTWQTESYSYIALNQPSHILKTDSGIYSHPPTAMSFSFHEANACSLEKPRKKNKSKLKKASSGTGIVSPTNGSKGFPNYYVQRDGPKAKQKTRLEKYIASMEKSNDEAVKIPEDENKRDPLVYEDLNNNVASPPVPPTNQSMITFAISSRTCHEKGWVLSKSPKSDPEYHTLVAWAKQRLQQAIRQKEEQDLEAKRNGLDEPLVRHYYGDDRREMTIKYKKGTKLARQLQDAKRTKQQLFMTSFPDGGLLISYPSKNVAVVRIQSASKQAGYYTLAYGDEDDGCRLVAYFTPTGRGVCYHKNNKIGLVSTDKDVALLSKDGAMLSKWMWSPYKFSPPLTFELSSCLKLRCAHRSSINLLVKIEGESTKLNVGAAGGAVDPDLDHMGSMMTVERFTSQTALELAKANMKPNEELKKVRYLKKDLSSHACLNKEESLNEKMKQLSLKFSESDNLAITNPHQAELRALQRKLRSIISDWMEYYRQVMGLSSPAVTSKRALRKEKLHSAPAKESSSGDEKTKKSGIRLRSAPPKLKCTRSNFKEFGKSQMIRPRSCTGNYRGTTKAMSNAILRRRSLSPPTSSAVQPSASKDPFRCGVPGQRGRRLVPMKDGCPVALRSELLGQQDARCRCDKRHIPIVTDVEFEEFLKSVPRTQLIIISIVTVSPSFVHSYEELVEKLYFEQNKNRSFPCVQSRNDPYRLVRYLMETAYSEDEELPLLLKKHNVAPGMFMMYQGARLVFADFILDGYGNSRKDFLKQVNKTRRDALKGLFLPDDFRFSPSTVSHRSPRPPWRSETGEPLETFSYKVSSGRCFHEESAPRIETPIDTLKFAMQLQIKSNENKKSTSPGDLHSSDTQRPTSVTGHVRRIAAPPSSQAPFDGPK